MPELQRLADELRDEGLELITVMLDGAPSAGRRLAGKLAIHAPVLVGTDELRHRMGVNAYPWTLILDRTGKPVHAVRGARSAGEFKDLFEKYL